MRPPPNADAVGYALAARRFSWLDPWAAHFREPLWIALAKATSAPFGYQVEALQGLSFVLSVAGLAACVWALWMLAPGRPSVVTGASLVVAMNASLITDAGAGGRDGVTLLLLAGAIGAAVRRPHLLPAVGAVGLGLRWEIGVAILVASAVLAVGRTIPVRALAVGGVAALVIAGPFVMNNATTFDDPMFHSNVHACSGRTLRAGTALRSLRRISTSRRGCTPS